MAELLHKTTPESVLFSDSRIAGLFPDRRMGHDKTARRIDEDRLATYAPEYEHSPLSRQYPDLIAVSAASGLWLARVHNRSLLDPSRRNYLPTSPVPVVSKQQS